MKIWSYQRLLEDLSIQSQLLNGKLYLDPLVQQTRCRIRKYIVGHSIYGSMMQRISNILYKARHPLIPLFGNIGLRVSR